MRCPCLSVAGLLATFVWGNVARADDERDAAIFGETATPAAAAPAESAPAAVPSATQIDSSLTDHLNIGGRLELRTQGGQQESQRFQEGAFSQSKQADIYFDSRPNDRMRAYLSGRFKENHSSPAGVTRSQDIDELWFKWNYDKQLFFTVGKQHLKWGSGKFWNPTDFTASASKDPFDLVDQRLGRDMIKVHLPFEKQGYNYYLILQYNDTTRNDQIGVALRGEYAVGGVAEVAWSMQSQAHAPLRLGFDISAGVGPVDVYAENAWSRRENRMFYTGAIDVASNTFPTVEQRTDDWFHQGVVGVQKTWKYSDDDNVTFGAEYFTNGLGYDDRKLELLSLLTGQSPALYAGKQYAGLYMQAIHPGSWNNTSLFLNGLQNISDDTTVVRLTSSFELFRQANIDIFASRCFGDYGEMCFRIPSDYKALATSPILTAEQQAMVAALPVKRTIFTAGAGLSMKF